MKHAIERRFVPGLEFREAAAGQPAVVSGFLVRYNDVAKIGKEYREQIAPGALEPEASVTLTVQHNDGKLISSFPSQMSLRESSEGLVVEANIMDTQEGRDAIVLLRNNVLTGFSSEFVAMRQRLKDINYRLVERARLFGASLVALPAYPMSRAALRSFKESIEGLEVEPDPEPKERPVQIHVPTLVG